MEKLLEKLFFSLKEEFEKQLTEKEKKKSIDGEIDVFKTYMSISKSQRDFRALIVSSAINKDILEIEFPKELIASGLKQKLIRRGGTINDNEFFLGSNGLFQHYVNKGLDVNTVFVNFDDNRFNQDKLKLKMQEKLLCIFLILFGADSEENMLDTTKLGEKKLQRYFQFLKLIEAELDRNGLKIGKKISWGSGKDISFRKFITNNVDLPNIGIYNDRPTSMYWLDFGKKRNVSFLMDLIFNTYSAEDRLIANVLFLEVLRHMSNKMLTELGEIPMSLNKYLLEELSS
tara:strand:- start:162 stop:1022 length:861 start_codon:yes stop_codon:yes gene_type:complete